MYGISFTTRKHHRWIQNTSTISNTNEPTLLLRFSTEVEETSMQDQYLPACAAAELIITGVEATNLTGAPRPVLAPGPTTKAPV